MKRAPQLFPIPAGTPPTKCKSCGQRMYWITTPTGASLPAAVERLLSGDLLTGAYEPSSAADGADGLGYSHHIDCPNADQHRKRKVQP